MTALWKYASQHRLAGCYDANSQQARADAARMVEVNVKAMKAGCPPEVLKQLDNICCGMEEIHDEDIEAAFVCGFRLGCALK